METGTGCYLVYTNVDAKTKADDMARQVVASKHAACVNIVGPVESVYEWQGRVETASEWMLIMKCSELQLDGLKKSVLDSHDYELPELIVLPIVEGHAPYLEWIHGSARMNP